MLLDRAGNGLDSASILPLNSSIHLKVQEQVGGLDLVDFYRFTLTSRSSLALTLIPQSGDVNLAIVNSQGKTLHNFTNLGTAANELNLTLEAATYYIQVNPSGVGTAQRAIDYTLTVKTGAHIQPNLLWHNQASGQAAEWFLKGVEFAGGGSPLKEGTDYQFTQLNPDRNWNLETSGDFNQDGRTDFVWRDYVTGQNVVWFMKGTDFIQNKTSPQLGVDYEFLMPVADLNWKIETAADFNADGFTDVVWRNYQTGENNIWYLKGTQFENRIDALKKGIDYEALLPIADLNWKVGAAADFNQDGFADLVWRNYKTGENVVWYLEKSQFRNPIDALKAGKDYDSLLSVADPNWMLETAADFNRDGRSDLVWRNYQTGENVVWYLQGVQFKNPLNALKQGVDYDPLLTIADRNWQIVGTIAQYGFLEPFAQGNVVLDWNAVLLKAIQRDRTAPPMASRNLAIVQTAVFDAINGLTQTYQNYAVTEATPLVASPVAAAAAAAYRVLATLYPNQIDSFNVALNTSLAAIPDGEAETKGIAFGDRVATTLLGLRSLDGSEQTVTYTPGTDPGDWQPTAPNTKALLPHWGTVKPFALTSGTQFRGDGPPALSSTDYAAEFYQVKELGSKTSLSRTAEQTEIAKFWADGAGTYTPPGHWNQIAGEIAAARNLSLVDQAHLFALLNIALADAGIAAWDAKYHYDFWRPVTAIRQGNNDGNIFTIADPSWEPLLETPPFPEYVSGHSTYSGAADAILTAILGKDVKFQAGSWGLPGVARSFNSFTQAAEEAGMSRIYGGIHFHSANVEGLATGRSVGGYALQNRLKFNKADTQAPVIQATLANDTAADGKTNTDGITRDPAIAGKIAETSAIAGFRAGLDNMAVDRFVDVLANIAANGQFTLTRSLLETINGGVLAEGDHTLKLIAMDAAGNESAVFSLKFTLDTKAPQPTIANTLNASSTVIDLDFGEGVTAAALVAGNYTLTNVVTGQPIAISAVEKFSDRRVGLNLAVPLAEGSFSLAIAAAVSDLAGNAVVVNGNAPLSFSITPQAVQISPTNGEELVALTRETIVRFGKKVDPKTVTPEALYLIANGERLAGRIVVSSTEEFATFFYDKPLPQSTEVRVMVDGDKITTRSGGALDADGNGVAGGKKTADFRTLPLTPIPGTEVWGYVYDSYNKTAEGKNIPLKGVKIRLDSLNIEAVTDEKGYFILKDVPAPEFYVYIDGSGVENAPTGVKYASLGKPFHSVPGQSVQLVMDGKPFDVYLPTMAASDVVQLSATQMTEVGFGPASLNALKQILPTVDQEMLKLAKVSFTPGSAQDDGGKDATQAMIVPVDPSRLPAPLPPNVTPGLVISIQAGGENGFNREANGGATNFDVPAAVTFPNLEGLKPGEKSLIWSFDHDAGEWVVIGTGTVSEDGKAIVSDPGVGILAPGWHFTNPGTTHEEMVKRDDCGRTGENAINSLRQGSASVFSGISTLLGTLDLVPFEVVVPALGITAGGPTGVITGAQIGAGIDSLLTFFSNLSGVIADEISSGEIQPGTKVQIGIAINNTWKGFQPGVGWKQTLSADLASWYIGIKSFEDQLSKAGQAISDLGESLFDCIKSVADSVQKTFEEVKMEVNELADQFTKTANEVVETIEQTGKLIKFIYYVGEIIEGKRPIPLPPLKSDLEILPPSATLLEILENSLNQAQEAFNFFQSRKFSGIKKAFESQQNAITNLQKDVLEIISPILVPASGAFYTVETNQGTVLARGRVSNSGKWNATLPPNDTLKVLYYDSITNLSWEDSVRTGNSGSSSRATRVIIDQTSIDSDNDGLSDKGELAVGTALNKADTDGDNINDLAEILQGLDPIGQRGFPTGIISNLPLRGEAKALVVEGSTVNSQNQTAYVATGNYGLAVVDASQFNNPIILGQLDLAGDATDVAVDPNLQIAAVATNTGGLNLVDVSDPMQPTVIRTVGTPVTQVEIANGIAYATVGNSLRAIDLLTGEEIQQLTLPGFGTVTDLAREGNNLYAFVSGSDTFTTIDISSETNARVLGSLGVSIASTDVGVFAANGVAYLAGSGLRTIDVSNPTPRLISNAASFFAARDVALNGSGLAVVASETQGIGIYNSTNPQNTNAFLTAVDTPGFAYDVAIASGIAFVADGTRGLQVINYRSFDNQGNAPTNVVLNSLVTDADLTTPGVQVVEGSTLSFRTSVQDDVQVRNVELLFNDVVVRNDVSFPFDLSAVAPNIAPGRNTLTVQVRATDTGGNTTLSNLLTFNLIEDTIAPTVVTTNPINNGTGENVEAITLRFNENINPALINLSGVTLTNLGADGAIGGGDDSAVALTAIEAPSARRLTVLPQKSLAAGNYRLVLNPSIVADNAGNALASPYTLDFKAVRSLDFARTDVPVGDRPGSVITADLDKDGILDLVVANPGFNAVTFSFEGNSISVLRGAGNGTFAAPVTYTTGKGPGVIAADLDKDGDVDLITANLEDDSLSILMNRGDGTFATPTTLAVGERPGIAPAADLDNDGDVDLITVNTVATSGVFTTGNTISILRNNGTGTFATPITLTVGNGVSSAITADIDQDGDLDIITVHERDNRIAVLINSGNGNFASPTFTSVGNRPVSVVADDFDRDGDLDLATSNFGNGTVSLLRNNGNGTFGTATSFRTEDYPGSLQVSDIDQDGDADLIMNHAVFFIGTTNSSGNTISVLKNNGNGTFVLPKTFATSERPFSLTIADLDQDGDPDVVTSNFADNNLSILRNKIS
jgi:hypothetical protein